MVRIRFFSGFFPLSLPALAVLLALGLVLPPAARADDDWLGIEVPRPMDQGFLDVNLKVAQTERDVWEDGKNYYDMVDAGGDVAVQDLTTLDARLDWRMEPRLVLELDVPTVFSEFSPYTPGVPQYYNVDTPGVEESQGLGDLRLGLRGAWRDKAAGFNAGWSLAVVAPTGLSPFDAPQTLAATGEGRWQVLPGFVFGGQSKSWEGWVQARGCLQAGAQVDSSSQAYLSWKSVVEDNAVVSTDNVSLPGGGAWLGPRYGADGVAGLAWIWYRDADTRMGLALEAKAHWLSPWTTAAGPLGLPAEEYFVLTPELQARYGRFSALVGWEAQDLWAVEEPVSIYGAITFDLAYAF